jgi:hypothetical protein
MYALRFASAQTTGSLPAEVTLTASPGSAPYGTSNTFTATVTPSEGTTPTGTVTFLDGTSTLGTGTLAPFLGNPVVTNVGQPSPLVFADVNNDGILDVVGLYTTNYQNVDVELGAGNGNFGPVIQTTTSLPDTMTIGGVGDLNGDGKPDLLVIDRTANVVEYFPGNGDGTFGSPIVIYHDSNPLTGAAAVADVNQDHLLDVVAIDSEAQLSSASVLTFVNQGGGNFSPPAIDQIEGEGSGYGGGLFVADLNGDGYPDLVVTITAPLEIPTVLPPTYILDLLNQGNGTFGAPRIIGALSGGDSAGIAIADFNGDKIPDLAVAGGGDIGISLGNGDGTFGTATATPIPPSVSGQVFAGSFHAKGIADLVVGGYVVPGNGDGTFRTPYVYDANVGVSGNTPDFPVGVADLTNDGLDDIAVVHYHGGPGPLLIYLSSNSSQASLTTAGLTVGTHSITAAYAGDSQFAAATSGTLTLTITPQSVAGTTTVLTSVIPNPAVAGQNIVFQALVTGLGSGPAPPTGVVALQSGSTVLGTATLNGSGAASFTTSFPTQGNQTVTASYTGDSNYTPSSTSVVEAILPAYLLAVSGSGSLTVTSGRSGTLALSVTPQNGFAGTVSMACDGLPANASCSFSPSSVAVSGTTAQNVNLTISTSANTAAVHSSFAALGALPAGFLLLTGFLSGGRRKTLKLLLVPVALLFLLPLLTACGSGSSSKGTTTSPSAPGTATGTYTVTLQTTSGTVSESTQITLVVD